MTDTMTNREAINILRVINPPRESKRIFDKFIQARDMAIKALEKLAAIKSRTSPSDDWEHYEDRLYDIAYQNGYERGKKDAEQDRWIPITERMPEENDFVLVTVSGEDVLGLRRRDWKDSMAIAVWTNQWNLVDANLVSYRISAWRPIPEPYTEEEV